MTNTIRWFPANMLWYSYFRKRVNALIAKYLLSFLFISAVSLTLSAQHNAHFFMFAQCSSR